jgi:hypothetical protein
MDQRIDDPAIHRTLITVTQHVRLGLSRVIRKSPDGQVSLDQEWDFWESRPIRIDLFLSAILFMENARREWFSRQRSIGTTLFPVLQDRRH